MIAYFGLSAESMSLTSDQQMEVNAAKYIDFLFQSKGKDSPYGEKHSKKVHHVRTKSPMEIAHNYARYALVDELIALVRKFEDKDREEDEVKEAFLGTFKPIFQKLSDLDEDDRGDFSDFIEAVTDEDIMASEASDVDIEGLSDIIIDNMERFQGMPFKQSVSAALALPAIKEHKLLSSESTYISASKCQSCHPGHFDEWAMSQHAYSQVSPIFMAMQNAINHLTSGTNGDFCIRCHNQVGMNKSESTYMKNELRHPASREGITCIVCHRISPGDVSDDVAIEKGSLTYGKVSGRMDLYEGNLQGLVFGPDGGHGSMTNKAIKDSSNPGIHSASGDFKQISTSGFCGTCHDVNLYNGFRLEEAFSEYKNSLAAKEGISCQDCHMGVTQGTVARMSDGTFDRANNYKVEPIVKDGRDRKRTNHMFSGPDHSIVHPGIFPSGEALNKVATFSEWLDFNYEAGWGSKRWENELGGKEKLIGPKAEGEKPSRWMYSKDRALGRKLLIRQFERLSKARRERVKVLREGFALKLDEELEAGIVNEKSTSGLDLSVGVFNPTTGHNTPTGFIAERLLWLHVSVYKDGQDLPIYESGDLDPNGDLRDSHSLFVHSAASRSKIADGLGAQRLMFKPSREIMHDESIPVELDKALFNLQSKFITRNIRGGEREQILAINHSVDSLPFIRPSTRSTVLTGQPAGARIHRLSLTPLGTQKARYKIPKGVMQGPGVYNVVIRLKGGMVPVNLVDAIKGGGYDYDLTTRTIARRLVFGFLQERRALARWSLPNQDIYDAIVNGSKRMSIATKHEAIMAVLNEADQKVFLDEMMIEDFAQSVQAKKIDHILGILKKGSFAEKWFSAGSEFMQLMDWVNESNIDRLNDLEHSLLKKKKGMSKEDLLVVDEALAVSAVKVSDPNVSADSPVYWKEEFQGVELGELVSAGLLLEKIAGHEVIDEMTIPVEVVK